MGYFAHSPKEMGLADSVHVKATSRSWSTLLHTLINCGWRYVTRAEADQWRDGRRSLPFLETQLRTDLARMNRIHLDERAYSFSEANIDAAVRRLTERIPEGVVRANERMTDDLTLGIALPQIIGATSREWPFKFIDWSDWRANTFSSSV